MLHWQEMEEWQCDFMSKCPCSFKEVCPLPDLPAPPRSEWTDLPVRPCVCAKETCLTCRCRSPCEWAELLADIQKQERERKISYKVRILLYFVLVFKALEQQSIRYRTLYTVQHPTFFHFPFLAPRNFSPSFSLSFFTSPTCHISFLSPLPQLSSPTLYHLHPSPSHHILSILSPPPSLPSFQLKRAACWLYGLVGDAEEAKARFLSGDDVSSSASMAPKSAPSFAPPPDPASLGWMQDAWNKFKRAPETTTTTAAPEPTTPKRREATPPPERPPTPEPNARPSKSGAAVAPERRGEEEPTAAPASSSLRHFPSAYSSTYVPSNYYTYSSRQTGRREDAPPAPPTAPPASSTPPPHSAPKFSHSEPPIPYFKK